MRNPSAHRLLKNGLLAMIIGLFGGFGLVFSMMGTLSLSPLPIFLDIPIPGSPAGWRMFHTGMLMNGMMAIVVGACLRVLEVPARATVIVTWGTLVAIWGNFTFYLFGMFAPNHGVSLQANRLGEATIAGAIAFIPAFIGALTLIVALIVLFRTRPAA